MGRLPRGETRKGRSAPPRHSPREGGWEGPAMRPGSHQGLQGPQGPCGVWLCRSRSHFQCSFRCKIEPGAFLPVSADPSHPTQEPSWSVVRSHGRPGFVNLTRARPSGVVGAPPRPARTVPKCSARSAVRAAQASNDSARLPGRPLELFQEDRARHGASCTAHRPESLFWPTSRPERDCCMWRPCTSPASKSQAHTRAVGTSGTEGVRCGSGLTGPSPWAQLLWSAG